MRSKRWSKVIGDLVEYRLQRRLQKALQWLLQFRQGCNDLQSHMARCLKDSGFIYKMAHIIKFLSKKISSLCPSFVERGQTDGRTGVLCMQRHKHRWNGQNNDLPLGWLWWVNKCFHKEMMISKNTFTCASDLVSLRCNDNLESQNPNHCEECCQYRPTQSANRSDK